MAKCRLCGKYVNWVERGDGRYMPVDWNGENHFRTCEGWRKAKADEWEKEKARREALAAEREARLGARQLELF